MSDLMERFAILPFSGACIAQSSIAVFEHHWPKRSKSEPKTKFCAMSALCEEDEEEEDESVTSFNMKNSLRLMSLPRLFKIFSQLFVYKEEIEEVEMEMEIGCPTNVKHVTHIGNDAMASQTNSLFVTCSNFIHDFDLD